MSRRQVVQFRIILRSFFFVGMEHRIFIRNGRKAQIEAVLRLDVSKGQPALNSIGENIANSWVLISLSSLSFIFELLAIHIIKITK